MSVRDFLTAIPSLCGAKDADRQAWVIGAMYDRELIGDSVFDKNEEDKENPDNRFRLVFAFDGGDRGRIEHCKRLVRILMFNHYVEDHNDKSYALIVDKNYRDALESEESYPDIAEVMPAEAAIMARWDD